MINYGNRSRVVEESPERSERPTTEETKEEGSKECFPNGRSTMEFSEFMDVIKTTCEDKEQAENYLVHAFKMFDKGK